MSTLAGRLARVAAAGLALGAASSARAFLGIADTSFVTVIANPAEAANWAAEIEKLSDQLGAARETLETVAQLRAYAGDPRAAAGALSDLSAITAVIGELSAGGQTQADLLRAWQALGAAQRGLDAAALLASAGSGSTMQVFGQARARDPGLYAGLAADTGTSQAVRGQIANEQAARSSLAAELALAWVRFRAAPTESSKQAILAEISQLQAQNQVMDTRRRAILDDIAVADRLERTEAGVRSLAADEQGLAESAALNSAVEGRARGAEAQRMSTLQKTAPPRPQPDYSGLRLWTTADSGGASN